MKKLSITILFLLAVTITFGQKSFHDFIVKDIEGNTFELSSLKGKKVLALSGIGTPDSFIKSLKELEAKVIDSIIYPDHYKYREKDLMDIAVKAQMQNVDWVITTEKDAVKFTEEMVTQFRKLKIGIFTLGVKLEVYENEGLVSVIA